MFHVNGRDKLNEPEGETVKILRYLAVGVMVSAAVFGACTSSNSPTSNINTNSSYDSTYRDQTRSANTQNNQQLAEAGELGDPPITLMIVGMEEGDIYPGEDYFVWVVDDNPDGRDLEYEWSIGNGDFFPVAEADRGRLRTLVEDEYNKAQPEAAVPLVEQPTDGALTEQPGDMQAVANPPGAQQPVAGGQPPAGGQPASGGQQQAAANTSGNQQNLNAAGVPKGSEADTAPPQNNQDQDLFSNVGGTGSGSGNTQNTGTGGTQQDSGTKTEDSGDKPRGYNVNDTLTSEYEYDLNGEIFPSIIPQGLDRWPNGQSFPPEFIQILQKLGNNEPLTADDAITFKAIDDKLRNWDDIEDLGNSQRDGAIGDGMIMRHMVIAGQAVIDDEGNRRDNTVAGNVVDKSIENATALLEEQLGEELPAPSAGSRNAERDSRGLRYEYQDWQEDDTEPRRRGLGGYGADYDDEEPLLEEESYERYSIITDDPYIEWTPRRPGTVNIFVRAMYHDEYVTEARKLEVEVRLRDPEVELSKDFPDVVREDESVYVRIDGSNLPDFDKGLFTLSYDNTKLSFRDAELGEFFDDFSDASIYYAQPNKDEGKVLLAVDSNTMLSEPSGDGPLVYIKFKAKEDLADAEESQLSMVMDTSARYILNKDGENILPLPLNLPPWRTTTTMPPDLPNYERKNTPGTEAGAAPTGNRVPPGAQAPTGQGTTGSQAANSQTGNTGSQFNTSTGFNQDAGFLSSGGGTSRPSGGNNTGGTPSGGTPTGGTTTGGTTTGGTTTGGTTTGGTTTGGDTTGGGTTGDGVLGRAQSDAEKEAAAEKAAESGDKGSATGDEPAADEPAGEEPTEDPTDDPDKPAEDPEPEDPAQKTEPQKDPPKKDA